MSQTFPLKSFVRTVAGYGEVTGYDAEKQIYSVQLASWSLSEGQPVNVFSQESSLASIVGAEAQTPYGVGKIVELSNVENGIYKIELTSWTLSEGQLVYVFSTGHNFKIVGGNAIVPQAAPEDVKSEEKPAEAVAAPAEEAKTVTAAVEPTPEPTPEVAVEAAPEVVADEVVVEKSAPAPKAEEPAAPVEPVAAETAPVVPEPAPVVAETPAPVVEEKKAEEEVKTNVAGLKVGDKVKTPYGTGVVVDYRASDEMYAIKLESWVLSGDSKVYVYSKNPFVLESAVAPAEAAPAAAAPVAPVAPAVEAAPAPAPAPAAEKPAQEKSEAEPKKRGGCCIA